MFPIFLITLKGVLRDRLFRGILIASVIFPVIPAVSTLSMRQVSELSITLSLSLISFLLLLLSIFLGATSLWKDMERRYANSIMGLPVRRVDYLLGKFAGFAVFIAGIAVLLGMVACTVVWFISSSYPPLRPIAWENFLLSIFADILKYVLLIGFAFLFSTVSTSFFLPIFGTICMFLVGSASQGVYDFIQSSSGLGFSPFIRVSTTVLYYLLPNFSSFDLKVNAVYGVALSFSGLALIFCYFAVYLAILLALSSIIFSRREIP